jgi:hypothetical protein
VPLPVLNEKENNDDDGFIVLTEPSPLSVAVAADAEMVLRLVLKQRMGPVEHRLGSISCWLL